MTTMRRAPADHALRLISGAALFVLVAVLFVLVGRAVVGGLSHLSLDFLLQNPSADPTRGGIGPAIQGTVILTLQMTVAGLPLGVVTGVYLAEIADDGRVARLVRAAIRALAGVPSVVFGLFGLGFFVLFVGSSLDAIVGSVRPFFGRPAVVWSSLTLAILTLPVIVVATEEAIRSVPVERKHAALALGASPLQVLFRVTLPGALPGILTGTILAIGRAAGEVAPILFCGAASFLPRLTQSPWDMHMHLGVHVYTLSTQSPDVDAAMPTIYATVLVLLATVLSLSAVAIVLRTRARRNR
jgi:phosphate transport system permease protein